MHKTSLKYSFDPLEGVAKQILLLIYFLDHHSYKNMTIVPKMLGYLKFKKIIKYLLCMNWRKAFLNVTGRIIFVVVNVKY